MKKRVTFAETIQRINKFGPQMGGVFGFADFWNLFGLSTSYQTAKVVQRLVREKVLTKIRRGIYTTDNPDLWILAARFKKNACISMDSVLAKEGLIGTVPVRSVSLIYPGNTQNVETPFGRLRFFKIKKTLMFGMKKLSGGVQCTNSEKAYLDLLYYHTKGAHFVIDPLQDVDFSKLNRKRLEQYLKAYKNPKFVQFVRRLLHENTR